jgi:hypothetical protein
MANIFGSMRCDQRLFLRPLREKRGLCLATNTIGTKRVFRFCGSALCRDSSICRGIRQSYGETSSPLPQLTHCKGTEEYSINQPIERLQSIAPPVGRSFVSDRIRVYSRPFAVKINSVSIGGDGSIADVTSTIASADRRAIPVERQS